MSKKEPKEPTREEIAITAYETFMAMMTMLQVRLDHAAARNYMTIKIEGMMAPFDRAQLTFVRPGGKSPEEITDDMKALSRSAVGIIDHIAKANDDPALRKYADELRSRIPTSNGSHRDKIVALATEVATHWRDQEGVNGRLLDELADLVAPK